ncbi:MAG: ATP-dependent DNA helicase RecG [Lachnospiraceae bacterium]|nr:ATP-dependent DNA helicase RecG [Lachnospiraceae bacterium]
MKETDSIRCVKGIGEKVQSCYARLGIVTVGDLLKHYPRSYDVYQPIQPLEQAEEGRVMVIEVSLTARPKIAYVKNLKIISCTVRDASGAIPVTWFNMPYLMRSLKMGTRYILRGKIVMKNGRLQMQQPKMLKREEYLSQLYKLQPLYPLTAGLTNYGIVKAVKQALADTELNGDFIPPEIRKEYELIPHKKAVQDIHFPQNEESYFNARNRLVFEEFFLFALALNQMKQNRHRKESVYVVEPGGQVEQLLAKLPYTLTEGQMEAWNSIKSDLNSGYVMNRLIQGDVGSGKTIVSVLALLTVAEHGHQGAIMVPTEVLAEQHYETFQELFEPLSVRVGLLTGSMTASEKRDIQEQIANHKLDIIVGTHALIQDKVSYADLALVVTDEQHRFGVRQREVFFAKGKEPHMLVMSATPIPRTLAIILYGDLDVSVMKGLPQGRLPIQNCVVGTNYRPSAYRFIEKEVQKGHQVYVICPMVEDSENMEAENVTDYAQSLRMALSPSVHVDTLHGRMKPAEKNEVMDRFAKGETNVLVSTTVIEVGINVPNATVMMVENAERFGLAQLHQLRGRVGRGSAQSYCIFMTGNPSKETMERLRVLERSNDGFLVAEEDLKLRGPGDLFGIRQSGDLDFSLADIYQDADILKRANDAASRFERTQVIDMCKKYEGLREKLEIYAGDIFL